MNVKAGLAARQTASKLLSAVVDRKVPLDGLLDTSNGNAAFRALPGHDRALVRAILVSALRHLTVIEAALAETLEKPLPDGARALYHTLCVGLAQVFFLDVPDRAAVDLAVEQARIDPRMRRFANLANAVMRRLAREKDVVLPRLMAEAPAAPAWFLAMLEADYGRDATVAILDALRHESPIDLTVKGDAAHWAETLGGTALATGSVRLGVIDGEIPALAGFADGAWFVQDTAASIPARLFGDLTGCSVADLCAAPGGKTAQLAIAGGRVVAFDRSENRLVRLRDNLARLKLEADCRVGDFMAVAEPSSFDAVLLDAPCSSTGTVRRHPDIVWTKGPADIETLAALQEKMLRHAITLAKPGGSIVFSNCSLASREGEEVVRRVLADMPAVRLEPIAPADWPGLEDAVAPQGWMRTTPAMLAHPSPAMSGLDGFFAARLRRIS